MRKSRSPLLTFWPSVKVTAVNSPATCDLICTIAEASTEPTTRSSVGTACCTTLTAETGVTGGAAAACCGACFWQPASVKRARTGTETRIKRNEIHPDIRSVSVRQGCFMEEPDGRRYRTIGAFAFVLEYN